MERVTINIEGPALRLVKERAEEAGMSVSAYVAEAAHRRALAEFFRAAAAAEAGELPGEAELSRDAERIVAKYAAESGAVPGAAA